MQSYLKLCEHRGLKSMSHVRTALAPFFLFLTEEGLHTIRDITPRLLDLFLNWAEAIDYQSAQHDISVLSTFFAWANQCGHHVGANPVIPKFHGQKRPVHLPRPYSEEEMSLIWKLAKTRGSSMIRAIVAVGEETGLRNGEICRLRLCDIDLTTMTLFVRLPNKGDEERFAFFHEKTAKYLAERLAERSSELGHDVVFHNTLGAPLNPGTLHHACQRTFCNMNGEDFENAGELDRWSTHRLRHTMASNLASAGATLAVIMGAGGWKSYSSMTLYAKVNLVAARRGYNEAMEKVREQESAERTVTSITNDEFLQLTDVIG